jgi:hypothetical protein
VDKLDHYFSQLPIEEINNIAIGWAYNIIIFTF